MDKPIGVFDSGIGGLTVLRELIHSLPDEDFIYLADNKNAPYGDLSEKRIIELSKKNTNYLVELNCKLIVVACNTATAAAIKELRNLFQIPIVGLEPAIKPACLNTKTGNVGVLATKGTFRGNHFKNTSQKYKDYVKLHLQVATGLVELAEKGDFNSKSAYDIVKCNLEKFENKDIDQIVLGCTHYPFFIDIIQKIAGENVKIIDSAEPVAKRTKDLLMINKILSFRKEHRKVIVLHSADNDFINNLVDSYLNIAKSHVIVEKSEK